MKKDNIITINRINQFSLVFGVITKTDVAWKKLFPYLKVGTVKLLVDNDTTLSYEITK